MNQLCTHINKIHDRYKTICADCYLVLEEDNIVNEVQFGENAGGAFMIGEHVDIGTDPS